MMSIITATDWSVGGLELRHLLALVAVADTGTFSAAAARLGFTQSAVSQQIAGLERAVGISLFDRPGGPRPVRLTEAGSALVDHAKAIIGRLRDAEAELRTLASGEAGTLRVGTMQSVGTKVLPGLVRRFRAGHPKVEIVLRESHDPLELLALVEAGDLDLTFAPLPVDESTFAVRWVLDDPFVFVTQADGELAGRASVSVRDVARLPLIGTRNASCYDAMTACFAGLDAEPDVVFRSDDNSTVQGCIAAGLAHGVLPLLTVDDDDPAVAVIPLDPPAPPRRIAVVWSPARRPPPSLTAFVDDAAEVCAGLS
jgi:DNA-binding transcriptional LysR family regulator